MTVIFLEHIKEEQGFFGLGENKNLKNLRGEKVQLEATLTATACFLHKPPLSSTVIHEADLKKKKSHRWNLLLHAAVYKSAEVSAISLPLKSDCLLCPKHKLNFIWFSCYSQQLQLPNHCTPCLSTTLGGRPTSLTQNIKITFSDLNKHKEQM